MKIIFHTLTQFLLIHLLFLCLSTVIIVSPNLICFLHTSTTSPSPTNDDHSPLIPCSICSHQAPTYFQDFHDTFASAGPHSFLGVLLWILTFHIITYLLSFYHVSLYHHWAHFVCQGFQEWIKIMRGDCFLWSEQYPDPYFFPS